jgi:hypothetical protein
MRWPLFFPLTQCLFCVARVSDCSAGYRPSTQVNQAAHSGTCVGDFCVTPQGAILIRFRPEYATTWLSLDGCSFSTT